MANEENLKPLNKRTKSEQREIAKKGGKASGESRKKRKALKDELLALLEDGDTQRLLCTALISQARRGNIKAFEVIRDTIGEKVVSPDLEFKVKHEQEGNKQNITVSVSLPSEMNDYAE